MPTDTFSDDFEDGRRKKRNAVLDIDLLWPGGIVPYEISSYFNGESHLAAVNINLLTVCISIAGSGHIIFLTEYYTGNMEMCQLH